MSAFTGVSIVADGKLSTTSVVDPGTDSGYHLLLVQGYSRTNQEIPTGEKISSGPFTVGGHRWCINYSPNGNDPGCADFICISLSLIIDEDVQAPVAAQFDFSFVDQVEEQKLMYIRATEICIFSIEYPHWGDDKFITRDAFERSDNMMGDCFTIRCDVTVCKDPNTHGDGTTMSDIGQHFNNLLENKVGADVTFEVSGEMFTAHRCVLAARSSVFMAQLFGPMMEGTTSSIIQIKDMEATVFKALLMFIYTGTFFLMDEDKAQTVQQDEEDEYVEYIMLLQNLLVAADIYDIQRLKFLCEKRLSENINVRSVASTLTLAEQHYCHRLKEACLKFIKVQSISCLEKLMATDDWEHIRTTYPSLLKEFVAKVASNQKTDKKRKR